MSGSTAYLDPLVSIARALLPRRPIVRLLTLAPEEASPRVRGFSVDSADVEGRLERVGHTFLHGYHAALRARSIRELADELERVETGWRGFAYEGAGMGSAILDALLPLGGRRRRTRLRELLEGPGDAHRYLVIVGAGWSLARVPRRLKSMLRSFDPVLAWLTLDGYGFHHGFFSWPRSVNGRRRPRRLKGYARRAFDQGLGRSLWFVQGASSHRIAEVVERFPKERRAGLWSGVGLACAYAGGADRGAIESLRRLAGPCRGHLAQGAAFAAIARHRAGEITPETERACRVLCDRGAVAAATVVSDVFAALDRQGGTTLHGPPEPTYETWRRRVRETLVAGPGCAPEVEA